MSKRRWSIYKDNLKFGESIDFRFNLTREEWIEQCMEWITPEELGDETPAEFRRYLKGMTDSALIGFIETTWCVRIRETTWLFCGGECYWKDPAGLTSDIHTIMDIRVEDNEIFEDTILLLSNGYSEVEAPFMECYGLTEKKCPKCGKPLFVSDLGGYDYVCLDCDENFDESEL